MFSKSTRKIYELRDSRWFECKMFVTAAGPGGVIVMQWLTAHGQWVGACSIVGYLLSERSFCCTRRNRQRE